MAEVLRHWHGGDTVYWGVLDRLARDPGRAWDRGLPGQCARDQESAGAQERCAGVSMADETAHLRIAAEFLPAAGRDSGGAHRLAAARPVGAGRGTCDSADPKSADDDEHSAGQSHPRWG